MTRHKNPDAALWVVEVGWRAASYTETVQRDLRWFRGLWEKGGRQ